jgi:hypothetical protein
VDKGETDSRLDIIAVHLMNLIGAVNDLNENLGRKMDTMIGLQKNIIELQKETIELQKEGLNSSKNLLEEVRKSRKDLI